MSPIRDIAPAALATERRLVGPPELDPTTSVGLYFARNGLGPSDIAAYTSHAAAIAAAAAAAAARASSSRWPTACSTRCAGAPS